ncbi:hypothetical protein [Ammonifex thiophilus]|uniref:Uncharacterized protein n=1 Tax=Ammonifex thiophilus TaxID=444093 RepID=A0A3D8P3X6_9THEO|nr:hypothetical protein [Ammonifex thiophilus]RDV83589.1 hypothetical protein DXX99_04635 [Ammonifex thiophilus]
MLEWQDIFTRRKYYFTEEGLKRVRKHVADLLAQRIKAGSSLEDMADKAARSWAKEYYELVFPLRLDAPEVEKIDGSINFRSRKQDPGFPPILPALGSGITETLLADAVVIRTALLNLLLRQRKVEKELLNAVRLASLVSPLAEELEEHLLSWPKGMELLLSAFQGKAPFPRDVDGDLVRAVSEAVFFLPRPRACRMS